MRTSVLAGLAMVAAVAGAASCDQGPEVVAAKWARKPSAQDIQEVYPEFARMARIPGRVKMRCEYDLEGALNKCRMLGVAPEGLNFDKPVGRLLAKYNVIPQTLDGRPAPAPITFIIAFDPSPAPPAYSGPPVTDGELAAGRRTVQVIRRFHGERVEHQASRSVALDRMDEVPGMVNRAFAAEGQAWYDAMARASIQAAMPSERQDPRLARGFVGIPGAARLEAVSPEFHAASVRLGARMRQEYCAAYPCSAEFPAAKEE